MSREFELRTYRLGDDEVADRYAEVHWPRHAESLRGFGVDTIGVWREIGAPRVTAVVVYSEGADVEAVTKAFLSSEAFRTDMDGFPAEAIEQVTTTRLRGVPLPP